MPLCAASRLLCAAMLVGLAGCGAPGNRSEPLRSTPIPFQLDAKGVQVGAQRVDFGRTDHSAERAMTRLVGQGVQARGACDNGGQYARWPDGTVLHFQNGAFRGWSSAGQDGVAAQAGQTCVITST